MLRKAIRARKIAANKINGWWMIAWAVAETAGGTLPDLLKILANRLFRCDHRNRMIEEPRVTTGMTF